MYIYLYSWNFASDRMCSPFLTAPQFNLSITYEGGVEFQIKNLNNLPSGFPFSDHAKFDVFTLLFCRGRLRNVHSFETHVLSCRSAH